MKQTDPYTYRARIQPALIVVLPLGLWFLAWTLDTSAISGALLGIVGTGGGTALLAQLGRDRGRRKQADLWRRWGGPPTTQLLRFRDSENRARLRQWRSGVETLVGHSLPSENQEANDATAADEEYEAAVHAVREATRDRTKFALVFAENVNYGFRRNLWGWKTIGLPIAVVAALGCWALFLMSVGLPPEESWMDSVVRHPDEATIVRLVASTLNSFVTAVWLVMITPAWVKVAAEAYAERLLDAVTLPNTDAQ